MDTQSTTDGPVSSGPKHNLGALNKAIVKLHRELAPLEAEKAGASEEIRSLRQTFKADTGMALADFDAARRLIMLEDEERHTKLDNFMVIYNALKPGEQINWVDAAEQADRPKPNGAVENGGGEAKTLVDPNAQGFAAALNGKGEVDNPYREGSGDAAAWQIGFGSGARQAEIRDAREDQSVLDAG